MAKSIRESSASTSSKTLHLAPQGLKSHLISDANVASAQISTRAEPPPIPDATGEDRPRDPRRGGPRSRGSPRARERGAARGTARGAAQAALTHLAAARPRRGRAERSPALPTCLGLERIALQRRARGSGCEQQPDMIG